MQYWERWRTAFRIWFFVPSPKCPFVEFLRFEEFPVIPKVSFSSCDQAQMCRQYMQIDSMMTRGKPDVKFFRSAVRTSKLDWKWNLWGLKRVLRQNSRVPVMIQGASLLYWTDQQCFFTCSWKAGLYNIVDSILDACANRKMFVEKEGFSRRGRKFWALLHLKIW